MPIVISGARWKPGLVLAVIGLTLAACSQANETPSIFAGFGGPYLEINNCGSVYVAPMKATMVHSERGTHDDVTSLVPTCPATR